MEPNPYEAPREAGYYTPQVGSPVASWLTDRATELALGILLAVVVLPFVVIVLWILGEI
jgi:hypothetical protein